MTKPASSGKGDGAAAGAVKQKSTTVGRTRKEDVCVRSGPDDDSGHRWRRRGAAGRRRRRSAPAAGDESVGPGARRRTARHREPTAPRARCHLGDTPRARAEGRTPRTRLALARWWGRSRGGEGPKSAHRRADGDARHMRREATRGLRTGAHARMPKRFAFCHANRRRRNGGVDQSGNAFRSGRITLPRTSRAGGFATIADSGVFTSTVSVRTKIIFQLTKHPV